MWYYKMWENCYFKGMINVVYHLIYHAGSDGKATKSDVGGLIQHIMRNAKESKNHSNENINNDLTKYNLDAFYNSEAGKYYVDNDGSGIDDAFNNRMKDYKGRYDVRKNQVVVRDMILQPSPEYFDGMNLQEKRNEMIRFSLDSMGWVLDEFGVEGENGNNVLGFSIHLDETNPHMHVPIIPMTEDGRISQTEFFKGPNDLRRMHKEFREHMIDKGWDFDLENKYEAIDNYDMPTFKANAKNIQKGRKDQTEAIRDLADTDKIKDEAFDIAYNVVMGELTEALELEREELEEERKRLEEERNALNDERVELLDFSEDLDVERNSILELRKSVESERDHLYEGVYKDEKRMKAIAKTYNNVTADIIDMSLGDRDVEYRSLSERLRNSDKIMRGDFYVNTIISAVDKGISSNGLNFRDINVLRNGLGGDYNKRMDQYVDGNDLDQGVDAGYEGPEL